MTLEEAIKHAIEQAANESLPLHCRREHRQLSRWLEEVMLRRHFDVQLQSALTSHTFDSSLPVSELMHDEIVDKGPDLARAVLREMEIETRVSPISARFDNAIRQLTEYVQAKASPSKR